MNSLSGEYGHFVLNSGGTYKITNTKIPNNWEYIYQNGDVLLRVDQYGLAYAQAKPVKDIILFWRTASDRYSKWMVWINSKEIGAVNNFSFPRTVEPVKGEITYYPEKAVYYYDYGIYSTTTEIMIPLKGTNIMMSVKIENNSGKTLDLDIMPTLYPYVNRADYPVWDKPEWYNKTTVGKRGRAIEFLTRLNDAYGDASRRRLATFHADGGAHSAEIRMDKYTGIGDFNMPDSVNCQQLALSCGDLGEGGIFDENKTVVCYPFVHACKYKLTLKSGESKTYTQVLSMQSIENYGEYSMAEAQDAVMFLDYDRRKAEEDKVKRYYEKLFSINSINTKNAMFDYYVNTFLALQTSWVASLDRGWPTGLRGVRDAANDFMGVLYFDEQWARSVLLDLYRCQRSDGWMPRQVSMVSRREKHDLRPYSDSGAFLMEFLYEYICKSGDIKVLDEKIPWLDSDEESPLYDHIKKSFQHYLSPQNIGEHGLVKIYEGDWMDALNRAGIKGRGESVMVTCQLIMNLHYAAEIIKAYNKEDEGLAKYYVYRAGELKENLNKYAYNEKAFYNGAFNDEGKWVFSDNDEDEEERYYGSVNYYAVLCGAAQGDRLKGILEKSERLKTEWGYRLFIPPFGKKPLSNVGRVASGDQPAGLFENGTIYNHVQGFRCRALAVAGDGDKLFETIQYMLPYTHLPYADKDCPPIPYAMTNCYQLLPFAPHRAGFTFLTGSIAMAVRVIYDCLLGIKPSVGGLCIHPCLPEGKKDIQAKYMFRGKIITVNYSGEGNSFAIYLNGKKVSGTKEDYLGRNLAFTSASDLTEENIVNVIYE